MKESDFKDASYEDNGIKAKIRFSRFFPRFKEAQIWLDNRINLDMSPYIPFRTGKLQGAIMAENTRRIGTGKLIAYTLPYGRPLYMGISQRTGKPINYSNPLSTPYWFETVKGLYVSNWLKGVEEIIRRK